MFLYYQVTASNLKSLAFREQLVKCLLADQLPNNPKPSRMDCGIRHYLQAKQPDEKKKHNVQPVPAW